MKFYRVLEQKYDYFTKNETVENELLTEKERNSKFRYIPDEYFEIVNISKKKTFWSFGCRFACAE